MTHAIEGLAPVREELSNGAVVTVKTAGTTPAVKISAAFRAGSVYDPPHLPGRAYFLSRVLDRGTLGRSGDALAEALDNRGVSLQISVTRHVITLACSCLAEDFEAVLDVVADMAQSPAFPEDEVQQHRHEILTTLRQDEDNPGMRASEALMRLVYGDRHPYGTSAKGTIASVTALGREDLLAVHASRFSPDALSLVIVGDLEVEAALDGARRYFGGWAARAGFEPPLMAPATVRQRQSVVFPMMSKPQADIAYGFLGVARRDPTYYAAVLMNHILGEYGLGGRLGEVIREQQGMAYYALSTFDGNVLPGPLAVRAGVAPENVERTLAAIETEIERLTRDGITAHELEDSRRYLVGSLPRTLETNSGIAKFLQIAEQFGLGLDYDRVLPALYASVTVEQVNEAARSILDTGRAAIAIAGPYDPARGQVDEALVAAESVAS